MEYSVKLDRESCAKDSRIVSSLETGGIHFKWDEEKIILSTTVWKFSAALKQ